ncbi:aminotransferase class V-fold PLP-dependent enzyme [Xylanibacillus composti]|uniref:cysteine desulfurase n=1 Tax=Xylanibacillus composti TaxID=1572762 RepID=A0A8J4H6X1_9BACL|nr:aminotransferase class V-fold PLP-dependent enzyme [Xylanibacillus composti]MDT9725194.1 aminotransferase class V-fold PLP-dependent enzyme [Xylanibacillus composti]GIQ70044.1 cysteine desulfurase [Xylanibacillus composti]
MQLIYLDNAASSWPKPPEVAQAVARTIEQCGANPGRGSHGMAVAASRILFEARTNLARLMGVNNPNDIAFCFNTTDALNLAIRGYVRPGDHVICTKVEHNAVWRPLEYLKRHHRVEVSYVEANERGELSLAELDQAFRPNTRLLICSHSSNLLGSILPIEKMAQIAHNHGAKILVDAAQTLGVYPVHVKDMQLDMVAFPGHKGLLGPQGTGGLYIHPDIELEPLRLGGTGSRSEEAEQPNIRPDRYEAGTLNTPGIAGLNEGVKYVQNETVESIHTKEWTLTQRMMEAFASMTGVRVLGPGLGEPRTGIVSIVLDAMDAAEAAFVLDQHFQIAVRAGYHCSPLAHQTAGTLGAGAVRISVGCFTTEQEIDACIEAVGQLSRT